MPIHSLPLDRIIVADRLRPVNDDYVELIAASLAERGQDTPIKVGPADAEGRHRLIAGGHRVAAAEMLGWAAIDAIIAEATGLEADLMEVDENLMRRELSPLDRAVFLARRKTIYEALHPTTKRGGSRPSGQTDKLVGLPPAFRTETAQRLGLDARSIERSVRRAALVADNPALHAALARSPVANSGSELDRLLEHPAAERARLIAALIREDRPARSVAAAIAETAGPAPTTKAAEQQTQFQRLMEAWRKADRRARDMFLAELVAEGHCILPAQSDAA